MTKKPKEEIKERPGKLLMTKATNEVEKNNSIGHKNFESRIKKGRNPCAKKSKSGGINKEALLAEKKVAKSNDFVNKKKKPRTKKSSTNEVKKEIVGKNVKKKNQTKKWKNGVDNYPGYRQIFSIRRENKEDEKKNFKLVLRASNKTTYRQQLNLISKTKKFLENLGSSENATERGNALLPTPLSIKQLNRREKNLRKKERNKLNLESQTTQQKVPAALPAFNVGWLNNTTIYSKETPFNLTNNKRPQQVGYFVNIIILITNQKIFNCLYKLLLYSMFVLNHRNSILFYCFSNSQFKQI